MAEALPSSAEYLIQVVCTLSFAALVFLFFRHLLGRRLLAYEPRKRVPWGAGVAVFAMGLPLLTVGTYLASLLSEGDPVATRQVTLDQLLIVGWSDTAFKVFFVVFAMLGLVSVLRADARDLGLPTSWRQFARDVGIGTFAAIASLLPIFFVQMSLANFFDSQTKHPLVKQIEENQSLEMLVLGFFMAVIVAPLFEEFTFRGLLQGWLERREDEVLANDATSRLPEAEWETSERMPTEQDTAAGPHVVVPAGTTLPLVSSDPQESHQATNTTLPLHPARGWSTSLPYGWTPILISGVLFGLAHLGHGVAPVSLILFGIVLGYLYQRTHRLAPCITAHMVFNAYSMVLLWLQLEAPAVP